jgi:hypothetical protein
MGMPPRLFWFVGRGGGGGRLILWEAGVEVGWGGGALHYALLTARNKTFETNPSYSVILC